MIRPYVEMLKYRSRVIIFFCGSLVGALLAGSEKGIHPLFPTIVGPLAMYLTGVFAYVYNDVRDIDTDRINAVNRPLVSGRASRDQALKLAVVSGVLALTLGLLLNPLVFATALFGIFLGYVYSTPPFSLKNYPVSKLVIASLWAGIASLGGTLAVSEITGRTLYAAVLFTVQGFALSSLADLSDLDGDRAVGKKTVAVVLGPTLTVRLSATLTASALVFTVIACALNILSFNWLFPVLLGVLSMMLIRWTFLMRNRYNDKVFVDGMVKRVCLASMAINSSLVIGAL